MDIYGNKLVNTIATKPLCTSSSNMADMLTMVRGWNLLTLDGKRMSPIDFVGQRSMSQWTYMEISL